MVASLTALQEELAKNQAHSAQLKVQLTQGEAQVGGERGRVHVYACRCKSCELYQRPMSSPSFSSSSPPLSLSPLQLHALRGEKDMILQQVAYLSTQLQESVRRVAELKGSKEQLEQNIFITQESLQQLQGEHKKVCVCVILGMKR